MRLQLILPLLATLITSSVSAPHEGLPLLNPGGIGGIFKGRGSETIIRGPDGSEITSEEEPGVIIRDDSLERKPIVVAEPEVLIPPEPPLINEENLIVNGPVISSTFAPLESSPSAPILNSAFISQSPISEAPLPPAQSSLLLGETYDDGSIVPQIPLEVSFAPIDTKPVQVIAQNPHIIETEIIPPLGTEPDGELDLKGPSGRIVTKGSASIVSGPASTTITEPGKIIVAPPKIVGTTVLATATIPLAEAVPVAPVIVSSASPPVVSFEASTIAPPGLSYSTTAAPVAYGYSTTATPLAVSSGVIDRRNFIPVVEYNSLRGFINEPGLTASGLISPSETSILSGSNSPITDKYLPITGPAVPSTYLVPPEISISSTEASLEAGAEASSTASPYIQKIPRLENSVTANGRVDMGDNEFKQNAYEIPEVLGMALARFYRKIKNMDKDTVTINDKLGDLSQNEIVTYDGKLYAPPNLAESEYIGPALERSGIDTSKVNLAPIPLSQVTKLSAGPYGYPVDQAFFPGRYQRRAKNKRSN